MVNTTVEALNASDGQILWNFEPDVPVWNFLALFPDKDAWLTCFKKLWLWLAPHGREYFEVFFFCALVSAV